MGFSGQTMDNSIAYQRDLDDRREYAKRMYDLGEPGEHSHGACPRCKWLEKHLRGGINPNALMMQVDIADGKLTRVTARDGRDEQIGE